MFIFWTLFFQMTCVKEITSLSDKISDCAQTAISPNHFIKWILFLICNSSFVHYVWQDGSRGDLGYGWRTVWWESWYLVTWNHLYWIGWVKESFYYTFENHFWLWLLIRSSCFYLMGHCYMWARQYEFIRFFSMLLYNIRRLLYLYYIFMLLI